MKSATGLQRSFYAVMRIALALAFIFSGLAFEARPAAQASGVSAPVYSSAGTSHPFGAHTSAYLIGKVTVGVVFPGSIADGATDENWTPEEKTAALAEISQGVGRWSTLMNTFSPGALTFVVEDIDTTFSSSGYNSQTSYEPIQERTPINVADTNAYLWINDVLDNYPLLTTSETDPKLAADDRMKTYITTLRGRHNADWGFVIFVVDSTLDDDDLFASGDFYYSDLYGPYTMVPFDAAAGATFSSNNFDVVISREVAHIFGASYHNACFGETVKFGYLAIADANCYTTNESLMDNLSLFDGTEVIPDTVTLQQVGWRDSDATPSDPDGDGIFDPVDTKPVVVMTPHADPTYDPVLNYQNDATHIYLAYDSPYPAAPCSIGDECYSQRKANESGDSISFTINKIVSVEFKVDDGAWLPVTESDGAFDTDYERYYFETAALSAGQHTISVRAINSAGAAGNQSTIITDKVTIVGEAENDLFSQATTITSLPFVNILDISLAGEEANDPTTSFCNQNRQGLQSVWYKYSAVTDVPVYLDTVGSDYDTYIAVWQGNTLNSLQPYPVYPDSNCNDDGVPPLQSKYTLYPITGQTYYIEVAKYGTGKGDVSGGELHFRAAANYFESINYWTNDYNYTDQGWRVALHSRITGDVNGDGNDDLIGFGYNGVLVALSTGSNFLPMSYWTTDYNYAVQGWRNELHPRTTGDVNGDGNDDLVGFGYNGVLVALSTGSSFLPMSYWTTDYNYAVQGWRNELHPRMVADVNGDKKDDLVGFGYNGVLVALSTGSGFAPMSYWTTDYNYAVQGWRSDLHPRTTGDVNGDGKDDLVGFGYNGVLVALSTGSGFAPMKYWTTDYNYTVQGWRNNLHPRMVADVNGDRKDDLVGFGYNGVLVALSTGSNFLPMSYWTSDYNYASQGWRIEQHPRLTGDVNGDEKADLVGFGYNGVLIAIAK